jgi:hypothetical protein
VSCIVEIHTTSSSSEPPPFWRDVAWFSRCWSDRVVLLPNDLLTNRTIARWLSAVVLNYRKEGLLCKDCVIVVERHRDNWCTEFRRSRFLIPVIEVLQCECWSSAIVHITLQIAILTLQLCPGNTVPECETSIGSTCTECAFCFVEADVIDGENVLRACGAGEGWGWRGRRTGHWSRGNIVSMAFKRVIAPGCQLSPVQVPLNLLLVSGWVPGCQCCT